MAGAVRQAGCRIARAEAGAVDDPAGRNVDVLAAVAGFGGGKARGLCSFYVRLSRMLLGSFLRGDFYHDAFSDGRFVVQQVLQIRDGR